MHTVILTDEEKAIVKAADKLDCLHETCRYEDYHPDYGRVEGYWKPSWFMLDMLKELKGKLK